MKKKRVEIIQEPERDWQFPLMIALMAFGAVLRFFQLGFNSLWLDEISTFNYSNGSLSQMWQTMISGTDYTPPLFFVFEKISLMIFGANEWSLRLFPAIFGVLTIPVIYYVGKEFWSKNVGLVAAGFFTFTPFLIYYSQEARSYSLTLLICALEFYYLMVSLNDKKSGYWMLFGLFAGLALWTHFYTIIFTGILLAFVAIKSLKDKDYFPITVSSVIFVATTLPITVSLISLFQQRTTAAPTYGMQGLDIIYHSSIQMAGYADYAAVVLISLFAIGCLWLYFKNRDQFALILSIIVVTFIVSLFMATKIPMLPRYLIFLTIPLSLGIGMAITKIPSKVNQKHAVWALLLLFLVLSIPFYTTYYTKLSKEDWRGVSQDLKLMTKNGDTVVAVPKYIEMPLGYYYLSFFDNTSLVGAMTIDDLKRIQNASYTANGTTFYVITSDIVAADPSGQALRWIQANSVVMKDYGSVIIARGD